MKAEFEHPVKEEFDVASQQAEIDAVSSRLEGIRIFKGIEIGLYHSCRERIRQHLSAWKFDQVIASVHYIDDTDPFYGGYYRDKDWKQAYGHYLETARYAPYPQSSILYRDFSDIFDPMLAYLAHEGKAVEINTKTYQDYHGRTPVLDKDILLRFKEFGGEFISLGSDSHDPDRTGDKFGYYAEFVKALGFRYLTHFEARRPVPLPV